MTLKSRVTNMNLAFCDLHPTLSRRLRDPGDGGLPPPATLPHGQGDQGQEGQGEAPAGEPGD